MFVPGEDGPIGASHPRRKSRGRLGSVEPPPVRVVGETGIGQEVERTRCVRVTRVRPLAVNTVHASPVSYHRYVEEVGGP